MHALLSGLFHILTLLLTQYGYPALFALLLLGVVGLPIPDETLLTFCGYLIYAGRMKFGLAFLAGVCGSAGGITISYMLGIRFSRPAVSGFGKYVLLNPERLASVERQFQRYGPALLTVGYFIPGVRHFTAVVAGLSGLERGKFMLFAYLGAVIWVGGFLALGYGVGDRWEHTSEVVHRYVLAGTLAAAMLMAGIWLVRRLRLRSKS